VSLSQEDQFKQLFGRQAVGIKEVDDGIWLVTFMDYDPGFIDLEEKTLQSLSNPFWPKVLPMSFVHSVIFVTSKLQTSRQGVNVLIKQFGIRLRPRLLA
jgi:hypothetical protein